MHRWRNVAGKLPKNDIQLHERVEAAYRRLCDAQAEDARPAPDVVTLAQVTRPSTTSDGLLAPARCFGDPLVMAILAALLLFCHVVAGFRNRDLADLVSNLLDQAYTGRQATYDLPRNGLITTLPGQGRPTRSSWPLLVRISLRENRC